MELTVGEIAEFVKGTLRGEAQRVIRGAAGLEEASDSDVSFLKDRKNENSAFFRQSKAGVIFVPEGTSANDKTLISVKNPLAAFASVLEKIQNERNPKRIGVHPTAHVSSKATLGKNVYVGPFCVIEDDVVIGDGTTLMAHCYIGLRTKIGQSCLLYPHVVIREDISVGDQCILHSGCILGSDGYGFFFFNGAHQKIPQVGTVVIESNVEIGSCSTIDRATTGKTIIRKGTKLDNLVQVAHNVDVGELSLLAAQVGIAGSTKLGKGVVMGGQSGCADHMKVADGTQVGGQGGIMTNTEPGDVLFGTPAIPVRESLKQSIYLKKISALFKDVKALKEKIKL